MHRIHCTDLAKRVGDTAGAKVVVQVKPATVDSANVNTSTLQQNVAGQVYDIRVLLRAANGTEQQVGDLAANGDQVTLPVESGVVDQDLLGVYPLNPKTNKWEYVGGTFNAKRDQVTVTLAQPGSYDVMAYDKSFIDIPAAYWAYRTI